MCTCVSVCVCAPVCMSVCEHVYVNIYVHVLEQTLVLLRPEATLGTIPQVPSTILPGRLSWLASEPRDWMSA